MCGICGIAAPAPLNQQAYAWVDKMNAAMQHRGPNGAGAYQTEYVALAMRRLSIIDLMGGWQPLYNEDRAIALIANGEIYNHVELRAHLSAKGHRFGTNSDCETIVHLYEEYGAACVHHLRGMFAFALWDNERQRLLLARDRMGEKPLYLYEHQGMLLFASELKALLRSGIVPFALDPVAVDRYFHYSYVPEPATPIQGVRKLPAAHLLTIDVDPWQIQEHCYWRMADAPALEGDPAQLIRAELETISELVIRADVPVGIALSGGVDSSAIAALAVRKYPEQMHAFTVGYTEPTHHDERAAARALAQTLQMPFHEITVTTAEVVDFFPELVCWRDDPIADISGHGYYAVMKLAQASGVPVVLQGQGGDELFWGYSWVQQAVIESGRKKALLANPLAALRYLTPQWPIPQTAGSLRRWATDGMGLRSGWRRLKRDTSSPNTQLIFYDLVTSFQVAQQERRRLFQSTFIEQVQETSAAALFSMAHPWPQVDTLMTRLICETYLLENGITQGDRLSMASSVELRLPLVDHKLVETVIGLRKTQPDSQQGPKQWFKAAIADLVPPEVQNRPKRGFTPPGMSWHPALAKAYGQQLVNGYLVETGVLQPESAAQLAEGYLTSKPLASLAFSALVLEVWCRQFATLATR